MKYFVVFSCVVVVALGLTPQIEEKLKNKIVTKSDDCKAEMGATDDDVAPMKKHEPPTTQKGKCFIACVSKKFGFQDASGKIDKAASEALIEKMKPFDEELYGKMKKGLENCMTEVSDAGDECETAFNLYVCAQKQHKDLGIKHIEF